MLLDSTRILLALLAGIIFYSLVRPVFLYLKDPLHLRKYPSPNLFAAVAPFWLIRATWSQRRSKTIHDNIGRLGNVIRISPNHLIFNDPAAIKDIYGVLALSRGVVKDEFYDRLAGDEYDLVQLRSREEHSERRKAIANAFAAKTVVNMESVIRGTLVQLLENIDRSVEQSAENTTANINIRLW